MLRYKVKIASDTQYVPIEFDDFYLSPDYTMFSGITTSSSNLNTGDMVRFSAGGTKDTAYVTTESFVRQGNVLYYEYFPINRDTYYGRDVMHILYNGVVYYYNEGGFTVKDLYGDVDDEEYTGYIFVPCDEDAEEVLLPMNAYIEDGKVQIGDDICYVDLDSQDAPVLKYNYMSMQMDEYNGSSITVNLLNREEWESFTRFYVYPNNLSPLEVNDSTPIYLEGFIKIGNAQYNIEANDDTSKESQTVVKVYDNTFQVSGLTACYGVLDFYASPADTLRVYLDETHRVRVENVYTGGKRGDHISLVFDYNSEFSEYEIGENDIVLAKSLRGKITTVDIETGNDGKQYITFGTNKYEVIPNLFDSVVINGVEYKFEYRKSDGGVDYGVILINGSYVPLELNGNTAKRMNNVFYLADDGYPQYGSQQTPYVVNTYDGVRINGEEYKVYKTDGVSTHVNIERNDTYRFKCVGYTGIGSYVLEPVMKGFDISDEEIEEKRIEICTDVGLNYTDYAFYLVKNTFGVNEIDYRKVYDEQIEFNPDMTPISSEDTYSPQSGDMEEFATAPIEDEFTLEKVADYYTLPLLLNNTSRGNIFQEDILMNTLYKQEVKKAIQEPIDFEKDIYYPAIAYKTSDDEMSNMLYELVDTIEINLHFRNRNLNTWKIYENGNNCNWFVTDRYPYRNKNVTEGDKLERTSDLIGLLKFTNNDVLNRSNKIAKSFIRISFYNSPDPGTRLLLGTYTVFMDENELYRKNGLYGNFENVVMGGSATTISVGTEELESAGSSNYTFDPERRLDCRFIIEDPRKSKTSSEGFHMYMYKGYSNGLHEETVYMNVEFNHAGVGKRTPFYLPMSWDGNEPKKLLSLKDDLPELLKGIPIDEYYKMSSIPVRLIYSEEHKKYLYYLPEECSNTTVGREEKRMVLNLYEVKINEDETN